ncbi:hypothetical protein VP01_1099g2 [Puccinia sorghi]|uniref:Uncharacterized protein n=1 Tax=Puccinia sorghi TaxID=27349 RepID=A0A0L6VT60_9BASI|nr:hypothetical protein VP01_1099g2 [Puccinia sorghi]
MTTTPWQIFGTAASGKGNNNLVVKSIKIHSNISEGLSVMFGVGFLGDPILPSGETWLLGCFFSCPQQRASSALGYLGGLKILAVQEFFCFLHNLPVEYLKPPIHLEIGPEVELLLGIVKEARSERRGNEPHLLEVLSGHRCSGSKSDRREEDMNNGTPLLEPLCVPLTHTCHETKNQDSEGDVSYDDAMSDNFTLYPLINGLMRNCSCSIADLQCCGKNYTFKKPISPTFLIQICAQGLIKVVHADIFHIIYIDNGSTYFLQYELSPGACVKYLSNSFSAAFLFFSHFLYSFLLLIFSVCFVYSLFMLLILELHFFVVQKTWISVHTPVFLNMHKTHGSQPKPSQQGQCVMMNRMENFMICNCTWL